MWPTFFIPLPFVDFFISGDPDFLCGQVTASSSTPAVIGNPTTIADGDTQLLIVTIWTNTSNTFPSDWRLVMDSTRVAAPAGAVYGDGWQRIYARKYTAGAPNFTVSIPSGVTAILYASMILRNQNSDDPWFNACWNLEAATAYRGDSPSGPNQYLEIANPGDLVIQTTGSATGLVAATNEPDSADVEFACTGEVSIAAVPRVGHTMAAVLGRRLANNLLTYTTDLNPSGWSNVGITRDTTASYSASAKGRVRINPTTGSSKHYLEQSVDLVAGETYQFSVAYWGNNASDAWIWLTYEKPDASEHGAGCKMAGNTDANLTGSTEVQWGLAGTAKRTLEVGNTSGVLGAIISIRIQPDVSGTYKLRIHNTNGTQPNTAHSGDTNDWIQISGVALVKGLAANTMPIFLPTEATPILPGESDYVLAVPPQQLANSSAKRSYANFIMRRAGGTRPVCKLFNQVTRGIYSDFADYTITDSRVLGSPEAEGSIAMRASHVVYDLLAAKKFYFELYVNSWGTGSVNDCYVIGAAPFEAVNCAVPNTGIDTVTGDYAGQFAYTAGGKTYTNGVLDGSTITAWQIGDYIGCGIDFTNWQITFYLNGTLVKTMSIPSGGLRDAFWTALFGFYSAYSADKQARMTYNFRGPFGGRKPSGFSAFDFDNELT